MLQYLLFMNTSTYLFKWLCCSLNGEVSVKKGCRNRRENRYPMTNPTINVTKHDATTAVSKACAV